MIKNNFVFIYILVILLCISKSAIACSANYMESAFYNADAVFIGKVTQVVTLQKASAELIQYQSGKLLDKSDWYWEKSLYNILNATIEVSETFKGIPSKTIEVYTPVSGNYGREYTVPFKEGEDFLVYAHNTKPLTLEYVTVGKQKMEVVVEVNKFNEKLPLLIATNCDQAFHIKHSGYAENEIKRLRSFAKNGLPKLPEGVMKPPPFLPLRVLY